jgi:hypothetical protein
MVAYVISNSVYDFLFSAFSSKFLYFVFLMRVILIGVRQNLSLVFICISLVAKDVECIFTYLLGISIFSFEKHFFSRLVHLYIALFVPLMCIFELFTYS